MRMPRIPKKRLPLDLEKVLAAAFFEHLFLKGFGIKSDAPFEELGVPGDVIGDQDLVAAPEFFGIGSPEKIFLCLRGFSLDEVVVPVLQIFEVIEVRDSFHIRISKQSRGFHLEHPAVVIVSKDRPAEPALPHPLGIEDKSGIVLGQGDSVLIAEAPNGLFFAADTDKKAVVMLFKGGGISDVQTGVMHLLQNVSGKNTVVQISR